jgi:hypothetical protein
MKYYCYCFFRITLDQEFSEFAQKVKFICFYSKIIMVTHT